MTTLENIDLIVERERDAAVDALCDGPFQLVEGPFVYDRDSWHSDCAQMITSMDADINDRLRTRIGSALYWLDAFDKKNTLTHNLFRATNLQSSLAEIGAIILGNAIANDLTAERIGE